MRLGDILEVEATCRPRISAGSSVFWPPLLFSGIRVKRIAPDWRSVEVELRLRWWNRNALGTMFGGSLFAMVDAFYPLMLQHNLGRDYAVWVKSAQIRFISRVARWRAPRCSSKATGSRRFVPQPRVTANLLPLFEILDHGLRWKADQPGEPAAICVAASARGHRSLGLLSCGRSDRARELRCPGSGALRMAGYGCSCQEVLSIKRLGPARARHRAPCGISSH